MKMKNIKSKITKQTSSEEKPELSDGIIIPPEVHNHQKQLGDY